MAKKKKKSPHREGRWVELLSQCSGIGQNILSCHPDTQQARLYPGVESEPSPFSTLRLAQGALFRQGTKWHFKFKTHKVRCADGRPGPLASAPHGHVSMPRLSTTSSLQLLRAQNGAQPSPGLTLGFLQRGEHSSAGLGSTLLLISSLFCLGVTRSSAQGSLLVG